MSDAIITVEEPTTVVVEQPVETIITIAAGDGGGAASNVQPGGSDKSIQYNSAGAFAGTDLFKYDEETNTLILGGPVASISDNEPPVVAIDASALGRAPFALKLAAGKDWESVYKPDGSVLFRQIFDGYQTHQSWSAPVTVHAPAGMTFDADGDHDVSVRFSGLKLATDNAYNRSRPHWVAGGTTYATADVPLTSLLAAFLYTFAWNGTDGSSVSSGARLMIEQLSGTAGDAVLTWRDASNNALWKLNLKTGAVEVHENPGNTDFVDLFGVYDQNGTRQFQVRKDGYVYANYCFLGNALRSTGYFENGGIWIDSGWHTAVGVGQMCVMVQAFDDDLHYRQANHASDLRAVVMGVTAPFNEGTWLVTRGLAQVNADNAAVAYGDRLVVSDTVDGFVTPSTDPSRPTVGYAMTTKAAGSPAIVRTWLAQNVQPAPPSNATLTISADTMPAVPAGYASVLWIQTSAGVPIGMYLVTP